MSPAPLITGHIKVHVGTLRIERRLLAFLKARCEETDLNFPKFLAGLIEREQSEFHQFLRRLIGREQNECLRTGWKLRPASVLPPRGSSSEEAPTETEGRPRRDALSDDDRDRIVVAMLSGETKIGAVAQRFGRGESTIRRAWKERSPSPEVIQKILFLHGKSGDEHIGVPAIAEACGIGQIIVEAILKNYRPLTPPSGAIYAHPPRPGGWQRNMVSPRG